MADVLKELVQQVKKMSYVCGICYHDILSFKSHSCSMCTDTICRACCAEHSVVVGRRPRWLRSRPYVECNSCRLVKSTYYQHLLSAML